MVKIEFYICLFTLFTIKSIVLLDYDGKKDKKIRGEKNPYLLGQFQVSHFISYKIFLYHIKFYGLFIITPTVGLFNFIICLLYPVRPK